jgi:hypothetical protein
MVGRPSPRKDQHTRKAEQVSWLAAWLTLCAFPFRVARNSGPCRFQCRSQLRGSNGFSLAPGGEHGCEGSPFSLGDPLVGDHSASPIHHAMSWKHPPRLPQGLTQDRSDRGAESTRPARRKSRAFACGWSPAGFRSLAPDNRPGRHAQRASHLRKQRGHPARSGMPSC